MIEAATGFLIAFVIPRLMGPAIYGHYVLIASLSLLFMLASTLGFMPVLGRYIPQFIKSGDHHSLQLFFSNLFVIRLFSAALCAAAFLLFTMTWLRDIDPLILKLAAVAMFCRSLSHFTFNLFLGLDQANRWGVGDIIRRVLSLVLVASGFWLFDLQGAMFAWLIIEVLVLGLGIWWVRETFTWPDLLKHPREIAPYLRFGLVFFASNLLLSAFERSGEALVRMISHDYVQVGYFGLAYNIYLAVGIALPEFALAFAPWLTTRKLEGQNNIIRIWTERLIKWMTIGSIIIIFATLMLSENIVPVILGQDYTPVATYLIPLMLSLFAVVLGSVARLLSLVFERPQHVLFATMMELIVFWAFAIPLIAWKGGLGASAAFFVASAVYGAYMTYRLQKEALYSLRTWFVVILTAVIFLPLIWLRAGIWLNLTLFIGFVICYSALLLLFKLVSKDEAVTIWHAFISTQTLKYRLPSTVSSTSNRE
jgi:O-antigen/teichoic acid export membrane protein